MKLHEFYGTAEFASDHLITESNLCEMARIRPANSGINVVMYALAKPENNRHWARIKVSNIRGKYSEDDNFSVSIAKEPAVMAGKPALKAAELDDIFDWVRINYDALMKFWNDQYENDADLYADLKKI